MLGTYSPHSRHSTPTQAPITIYGTNWCAQTMLLRRHLERLGIPYTYINLETSPEAVNQLRWWTGGSASHPTVYIGGEVLVEPSTYEIERALRRRGWR